MYTISRVPLKIQQWNCNKAAKTVKAQLLALYKHVTANCSNFFHVQELASNSVKLKSWI